MTSIGGAARSASGPRIIVALDVPDQADALALADRLDPGRCRVKVGKALFTRAGPAVVAALHQRGFEVFLDLKFHDIPNTVAGACRSAAELGVWMVNVHACGGGAMMRAARDALSARDSAPLLIAVTVLTSLDRGDLEEVGVTSDPQLQALRLARLTEACGLDGIVCSPSDLAALREILAPGFVAVTPGIRPAGVAVDDQKRVSTPRAAIEAGASYLVIGRPVTAAEDPGRALRQIEAQLGRPRAGE